MRKFTKTIPLTIISIVLVIICFVIPMIWDLSTSYLSFLAAIIGGIVSGGLTLIGVILTLESENSNRFIEMYPKRKIKLQKAIEIMNKTQKYLWGHFRDGYKESEYAEFREEFRQEIEIHENLIQESIEISAESYLITRRFVRVLTEIDSIITYNTREVDRYGRPQFVDNILTDKERYKELVSILEYNYKNMEKQMIQLDKQYKKYTGF